MIKRSLLVLAAVLLYTATTFAQQWTYQGLMPADATKLKVNTGTQFLVVAPDGKIWVAPYRTDADSVWVPDSMKMKKVYPIYVFNADGTPSDTVRAVTIAGKFYPLYYSKYGIEKDNNGNILVCDYDVLYRINYQTKEGMNVTNPLYNKALCSPAVDQEGNIYLATVLAGNPVWVYNSDFTFKANAVDTLPNIGRWIEVSLDGNVIYTPRFTEAKMRRYSRASAFDPYVMDTLLQGIVCESGIWDPKDPTKLWLSTGSYLAGSVPTGQFAGSEGTWYMFDTATWAKKDSIKWQFTYPGADSERPRGLAFSLDGKKAYVASFGAMNDSTIQVFNNPQHVVSVEKEENTVVNNYTLGQNYPNPFNPSTKINFTVMNEGFVTLRVYNLLGEVVATLVNENLGNGSYTVNFDASKLSSGTYVYELNIGDVRISKKMMLMK